MSGTSVILLAGGKSTRIGTEKSSLPFGEGSLLEYVTGKIKTLAKEVIIVGRPKVVPEGAILVDDVFIDHGPLAGIHAGLAASTSPRALVHACDMPFVPASLLRHMDETVQSHTDIDAVVPFTGGNYEPTVAIYSKSCMEPIEAVLARHDRPRIIEFFPKVEVMSVSHETLGRFGDPKQMFYNINTKDEYLEALGILGFPPVLCVSGLSDTGKTTLISRLLSEMNRRGYRVAVMKHHRGDFDIDVPGKDTWLYHRAGAKEIAIVGATRSAFLTYAEGTLALSSAAGRMLKSKPQIDLILAEGFSKDPALRIIITQNTKTFEAGESFPGSCSAIIAFVTDSPASMRGVTGNVPVFDRDDPVSIVDMIEDAILLPWKGHKDRAKGSNVVRGDVPVDPPTHGCDCN
jgi:molybdopterin-guanine dinucleotide biosynthesis protein MobB